MSGFIVKGRVFDLVLLLVSVELVVLLAYRLRQGRHLLPPDVPAHLCAAIGLLAATHAALAGYWWGYTGLCLAVSLLAHVQALRLRWRRPVTIGVVNGSEPVQPSFSSMSAR